MVRSFFFSRPTPSFLKHLSISLLDSKFRIFWIYYFYSQNLTHQEPYCLKILTTSLSLINPLLAPMFKICISIKILQIFITIYLIKLLK